MQLSRPLSKEYEERAMILMPQQHVTIRKNVECWRLIMASRGLEERQKREPAQPVEQRVKEGFRRRRRLRDC